ncbi:MAG: L,D-transpeptidase family protein, partial [Candidatus Omnitrophica bacterium]|nr:L,D-transpeptidase family protein [Candidatus Omnitrophota bacterium]
QQLAQLYKKQGKQELYLAEMEKIKGKKQPLLAFKKPEIKRPVSEKKPEVPEKILLSQKIDIGPYNFLVVDKSLQSLIVYQFDGIEIRKILDVVCTTGKNMEDKKKPGDLATPEGTFLIRSFIPGEKLDPKYGAGAYVLDFPDYLSRRLDKDGSGIWLHGTPIERPPYNSEGCVVVNDSDFQKISEFIEPGKTYIHIVKQVKDVNISDMNLVWELVQEWKKSWENLETERYLSFYSEKFKSDGKDKKTWAEYKKRVNKNKRFVNIELSNSVLVPYGNTDFGYVFLLDTIQKYESNNLKSTTRKNLYLAKENGTYKIIGELVK